MLLVKSNGEVITSKFDLEDIVYLKINHEVFGMIVSVCFTVNNGILYNISCGDTGITAYECELDDTRVEVRNDRERSKDT